MAHPQTSSATPRRWGQSLVEFALVAPLLVILVVGVIELGIIFSVYIGLTNSAREGVRAAAVYRWPGATPTNAQANTAVPTIDAAREAFMRAAIDAALPPFVAPAEVTPTVAYVPARTTVADRQANPLRSGDVITLTLQQTRRVLWGLLGPTDLVLRTSATARIEPGGGN
jgi:Flp pilus assembly protein TadG